MCARPTLAPGDSGFAGDGTLPRKAKLRDNGRVYRLPAAALEPFRWAAFFGEKDE